MSTSKFVEPNSAGRLARDAGMMLIRQYGSTKQSFSSKRHGHTIGLLDEATGLFQQSMDVLESDTVEHEVSRGFHGRRYLLDGYTVKAWYILATVDQALEASDNRYYELSNLMWLIRTVTGAGRRMLRRRIIALIHETGQTQRLG